MCRRSRSSSLLSIVAVLAGLSFVAPAAMGAEPEATRLVALWPGNDSTEDIILQNNGTLVNGTYGDGQVKDAFVFAGDGYMHARGTGWYQFGVRAFSVAFWFRIDQFIDDGTAFVSKDNYAGADEFNGWLFNCSSERGGCGFEVRETPMTRDDARVMTPLAGWHQMVGVRNGNILRLFIDGRLATTTQTRKIANVSNSAGLRIGALSDASPQFLHGAIDDVRIYPTWLSAKQVKRLFRATGGEMRQGR